MKLPNAAERERLVLLIEECAEVIHASTKILRHGYSSHHPVGGPNNHEELQRELGNLRFAIKLMACAHDIDGDRIHEAALDKAESVREYLRHQPESLLDRAWEAVK